MVQAIKNTATSFFDFLKSKEIIKKIIAILFFVIVFLYSGYTLGGIPQYRTYFNAFLVFFAASLLFYHLLTKKIPETDKKPKEIILSLIKSFKFDFSIYYLITLITISIISMVVNSDFSNNGLLSFVSTVSVFAAAYGFTKVFSFKEFAHIFSKIFPVICLVSLGIYALVNIFDITHPFMSFSSSYANYDNYFFIYFKYIGLESRNCSIFWEPALFSLFICLGTFFEFVFYKERIRVLVVLLYFVSLLTTFSLSGFIILFAIIFVGILITPKEKFDKNMWFFIAIVVSLSLAVVLVIIAKPELISKFSFFGKSGSLSTRIFGNYVNLRIMLDHPFGVSFSQESLYFEQYTVSLALSSRVDSQTSTFGYWLSAFGFMGWLLLIAPIVALLTNKKIDVASRIAIIPLTLLFMISEPLQNNLTFLIMVFYCLNEFTFFGKKTNEETQSSSLSERFLQNSNNSILAKNSIGAIIVKGLAMLVSLFTTSAYILYFMDPKGDGLLPVWFSILSVLTWILIFDLGIGHGLKNKLIFAYENNDEEKVKKLVSSSYFFTFLISMLFLIVGSVLIWTTNMFVVFNVNPSLIDLQSFRLALWIILLAICLSFVLKIVGNIFESLQKQGVSNAFSIFNTLILLIYVSCFTFNVNSQRLVGLAIAYLIASTIPYLVGTVILFSTKFKNKFSFKSVTIDDAKSVISLGGLFFLIQICMLLINSSNTILIQQLYATTTIGATVQYTYYHKIYNVVITIIQLFSGPLWAIVAKASSAGDVKYIKKTNKLLLVLSIVSIVFNLLIFALLPTIFRVWIPDAEFTFSWITNLIFALTTSIICVTSMSTVISNGLSKLKYQVTGFVIGLFLKIFFIIALVILRQNGISLPWCVIELSTAIAYLPVLILVPIGNNKYIKLAAKNG